MDPSDHDGNKPDTRGPSVLNTVATPVDPASMTIHENVTARVQFDSSNATFQNTIGMYTYDSTGKITSTQLLFGDESSKGVVGGSAAFNVALKAGDQIGFFVAPNAASQGDILDLIKQGGSFHLVNTTNGQTANVNSGVPMQLAYESPTGQWSNVHTQYWTSVFTSSAGNNPDGLQHVHVTTDQKSGQMRVQFEDQMNNGDQSFANGTFTVDLGRDNSKLLSQPVASKAADNSGADHHQDDGKGNGDGGHTDNCDSDHHHSDKGAGDANTYVVDARNVADKLVVTVSGVSAEDVTVTNGSVVASTSTSAVTNKVTLGKFSLDNGDKVTVNETMGKAGEKITIHSQEGSQYEKISFVIGADDANQTYVIDVKDNGHNDTVTITTGANGAVSNVTVADAAAATTPATTGSKGQGHHSGSGHDGTDDDNIDFSQLRGTTTPTFGQSGGSHLPGGTSPGNSSPNTQMASQHASTSDVSHSFELSTTTDTLHHQAASDPLHSGHLYC